MSDAEADVPDGGGEDCDVDPVEQLVVSLGSDVVSDEEFVIERFRGRFGWLLDADVDEDPPEDDKDASGLVLGRVGLKRAGDMKRGAAAPATENNDENTEWGG